MNPKAAVNVKCCSPDACAAEKVVTEQLACVAGVVLEPFKIEFPDAFYFVVAVFDKFAKVYTKMTMLPICSIGNVFSVITMRFRSATETAMMCFHRA